MFGWAKPAVPNEETNYDISTDVKLDSKQWKQIGCQTAGWVRIPLGTEVGLGPCDMVLDGDPSPPARKGAQH